jgi:hypothetical protein
MALEFTGDPDAYVTFNLPSHPTELFITCEVYIPASEILWLTDVNATETIGNIRTDVGSFEQGVYLAPNGPGDYAWFDSNDYLIRPIAHPISTAGGAYSVSIHCIADFVNGDGSDVTVNADSESVVVASGNGRSYANYYDQIDLGLYETDGVADGRRSLFIRNITVGTTLGGTDLLSNAGTLTGWSSTTGTVAESAWPGDPPPEVSTGGVRIGVAFDDPTLDATPTWTYLTDTPNLVAGYEKQVGRQFEFDKTEAGTAKVTVLDRDGVLDPTNTTGPYYGLIEPLLQIQIELWNPITLDYHSRFRGFIEDYDYVVEPYTHQDSGGNTVGLTRLEISCIDLFPICTAIEMQPESPPSFGDDPATAGTDASGNIFFAAATAQDRISQVETNAFGATFMAARCVTFTLNVNLQETVYSPGQSVLEVIQEACDAEFPTVSNVYCDRFGRLVVHGRLAKFDPAGTASDAGADQWDFHAWKIGDGKAVVTSPTDTAHIRSFAFNRGWSKIHNYAICTPKGIDDPPTVPGTSDIPGQVSKNAPSIAQYGYQSWTATELIIGALSGDPLTGVAGILTGLNALEETKLYADFIVANYSSPQNRISDVTFRSMRPDDTGAAANWEFLCKVDIGDTAACYIRGPGDGPTEYIFNGEVFFVEGVRETVLPLAGDYANVTTTLDLSPKANFTTGAWSGD